MYRLHDYMCIQSLLSVPLGLISVVTSSPVIVKHRCKR